MFITHCPSVTPNFITSICSGLVVQVYFLHCCVAIGTISTDTTQVCWISLQSDQQLRGPRVSWGRKAAERRQMSLDSRYAISASGARTLQQAARRCCCRPTGQTDRQTDGLTFDRFKTLPHYYADGDNTWQIKLFPPLFEKYIYILTSKWPAQGTSTVRSVPMVSAHSHFLYACAFCR